RRVNAGDDVTAPLGGNQCTAFSLQAFNDNSDIAFINNVAGSSVGTQGLFRSRSAGLEIAAYRSQPSPGVAGQTFGTFIALSMNNAGLISFRASLAGGTVGSGFFQQTPGGLPTLVVADGLEASVQGGGAYS